MSKENYETCAHVKSIGQIAVYVTPSCPQATQIKGHLVSSKERCRRCRVFKERSDGDGQRNFIQSKAKR